MENCFAKGYFGRIAVSFILAALPAGCADLIPEQPNKGVPALPATVRVRSNGRILTISLDDYVLGTVLSEVSPVGETEQAAARILEVQAVIARTYAVFELGRHQAEGFDLCDSTHCQVYDPSRLKTSRFAESARAAVSRTTGQILTYRGRAAETLFHADCGGYTDGADAVWGGAPQPYLVAIPDEILPSVHRIWQATISTGKLRAALTADARTRAAGAFSDIRIATRDVSGRAAEITLTGDIPVTVRGEDLRAVINQSLGDRTILSTRFTIEHTPSGFVFTGTGYGHGVGLCQIGAAARARRGDTVDAILRQYFPSTTLTR